jgi:26S proteasome regulatory subunit N10|eukprot:CAMPEP_0174327362 /NCGR_PEP_ID=MMETSP0810-20121108/14472_1 /TAXON_ID=73025 ORGANISM="Eutreptiella gymnastica-like, Strain CCMP1594" /NCGR_SAMPLE_ID=MMETSP0810 /ASSEMBLY_ACC=CAM_ASM_000659 /LENGTH=363 /DNA_ID=CAMNT_0015441195 /DNA_START=23 /DNA_END=1114 /DNA_ORIENTATION=-
MVLEATFLCVDNSEFMRNGDFAPTRARAVHEACNLVVGAKTQSNPENTVGLLTMGGKSVTLLETLTNNLGKMLAALSTVQTCGDLHFTGSMQIAALGLKHRQNKQQRQRIVAFVASPIEESQKQLETLGKRLRKEGVAVDVVAFGVEDNVPKLEAFIGALNRQESGQEQSHLINVPTGVTLAEVLVSSPLIAEDGVPAARLGAGGDAGDFGGDLDYADPELAMVIRMSIEEEKRREEAEAKKKAEAEGKEAGASSSSGGDAEAKPMAMDEDLTEEQQLEMALKMSMQEDTGGDKKPAESSSKPMEEMTEEEQMEMALKMSMNVDTEAGVDDVMNDDKYMAQLAQQIAGIKPEEVKKKEDEDKK